MNLKNEFWAFIPARKGSKTIRNKNILKINKVPLIGYSLKTAKKSKLIKKTIFSSDSSKYFKIAKKFGYDIPHLRDKKTSNDKANDLVVFVDFIKKFYKKNNYLPKFFVHFRPTTPIRNLTTIDKAIKLMKKNHKNFSSLRSVRLMPDPAFKCLRIVDKKLCSIFKKDFSLDKVNKSRHKYEKTYDADGIIDIYKTEVMLKKTLLGNKVLPFVTQDTYSNIDTLEQLKSVRSILKKTRKRS